MVVLALAAAQDEVEFKYKWEGRKWGRKETRKENKKERNPKKEITIERLLEEQ